MVVYFVGVILTRRIAWLRAYNIPEPVIGGFLAAIVIWALYSVSGFSIDFEMATRDKLLVIFFASVGVNARLSNLLAGGRPLGVLTVIFVVLQNVFGRLGVSLFGLPSAAGVIMGSVALVGGHGTTIAWAPAIAAEHDFPAAMETGTAVATLGLVIASVLGGPVAKFLIERDKLIADAEPASSADIAPEAASPSTLPSIDTLSIMHALLVVNIAVILGYLVHRPMAAMGMKLPLFVPCLLMGILLSNTVPFIFPKNALAGAPHLRWR